MPLNDDLIIYEYLLYPYEVLMPIIMGEIAACLMIEHKNINNLSTGVR